MFTVDIIFREDILKDIVHVKQEKHRLNGKCTFHVKKMLSNVFASAVLNSSYFRTFIRNMWYSEHKTHKGLECIPVGCVPSAAVAMCIPACTGQGVCVS